MRNRCQRNRCQVYTLHSIFSSPHHTKGNATFFFFGSDQANLLKFDQNHSNNRHFESLNRYFQEEKENHKFILNGKSPQKVCQAPKSQVAGLKVTEKSTTHIRRKRVNSQSRHKGHSAWRIEQKRTTDHGQRTKEFAGHKQQDTSYRSPPKGDGQKVRRRQTILTLLKRGSTPRG